LIWNIDIDTLHGVEGGKSYRKGPMDNLKIILQ